MSMVTGVDFAFVPVHDFARAVEFYGTTLGLPLSTRYERMDGAEFTPSRNAIALGVEDVAAARAELEAKGVQFYGDTVDTGVCHQAYFNDPEGHALILHHRYAPR
jgi:predicted enzyme related to lactoylglutathione lyase